jgi:hypothetical protein
MPTPKMTNIRVVLLIIAYKGSLDNDFLVVKVGFRNEDMKSPQHMDTGCVRPTITTALVVY